MAEMLRALMWGAALGCLGFLVVILGSWISQFIPGLPVADSMMLIRSAMLNGTDPLPPGQAERILGAEHWYREAALPALVGISLGAVVGLIRRPTSFEALAAGGSFAVFSRLLGGSMSSASWIGVACFLFCLLGAETMSRDLASLQKGSGRTKRELSQSVKNRIECSLEGRRPLPVIPDRERPGAKSVRARGE
ncbi:MAG: hypothetical protein M3O15_05715, partial [Acidobacteriota bacterium]|nr:hypothetical protein [Acidobacteriota bacterium]